MISLNTFLVSVQKNAARVHSYQSGHDGSDGTCDCIGLPIGAVRLAGEKWPWTHGSNYTVRNRMKTLREVFSADDLHVGELVYKSREPGESDYDLPSAYKGHPDQRDYYHVGVVTGVSPLEITHCTKSGDASGIFRDSKVGKWRWAGELDLVDYTDAEDDATPIYEATVNAPSGKTVRLRREPSLNANVLAAVPLGARVGVMGWYDDDWSRVQYNGQRGYMMTKYLTQLDYVPDTDAGEDQGAVLIPRERLTALQLLLDECQLIIHDYLH